MYSDKLLGTERFDDMYLPEIFELLNDEESYIRIEAIEALLEVLEHLDAKKVEESFVPNMIKAFEIEHNHDEIILKMAEIIGRIVYKLSTYDLHMKYKDKILTFFLYVCNSKNDEVKAFGIYNLPCFH